MRGINLAWLDGAYRHDFGVDPLHKDWSIAFDEGHLSTYFADMQRMNLNVVRVFVFEDLEGLVFENGYVERLDQTLLANLDTAAKLAQDYRLHLYLALANNFTDSCRRGGFKDIVTDQVARKRYLENAVKPLASRFRGNENVFAFDIMNEPEQEIAGREGNWRNDGCSWTQMRSFIRANAKTIHEADSKRLVSCGSGWHSFEGLQKRRYFGLGLDFYDVHEYRNDGYLPPVSGLHVDRPVLIGEFNIAVNKDSPPTIAQDDGLQNRVVATFLRNARDGGYAGAIVWDYDWPGVKERGRAHCILRGDGSAEWRPACFTLRDFQWSRSSDVERSAK